MPTSIALFAEDRGLSLTAESILVVPRDVLLPLKEQEQHYLVRLHHPTGPGTSPLELIFVSPLSDPRTPTLARVLWWTAADAWALEQSERDLVQWAAIYDYSPEDPAALRLLQQHERQADALRALLGDADYMRLLDLYARAIREGPGNAP